MDHILFSWNSNFFQTNINEVSLIIYYLTLFSDLGSFDTARRVAWRILQINGTITPSHISVGEKSHALRVKLSLWIMFNANLFLLLSSPVLLHYLNPSYIFLVSWYISTALSLYRILRPQSYLTGVLDRSSNLFFFNSNNWIRIIVVGYQWHISTSCHT